MQGLKWAAGVVARLAVAAGLVLALLTGVTALRERAEARVETREQTLLPVAFVMFEQEDSHALTERFTGRVEARRSAGLGFERAGLVVAVDADEGVAVRAGQVLARLDTALLEAERDRLGAERRRVAAALDLAARTYDRQRNLQSQGHASAQRLDEARQELEVQRAALAALDASVRAVAIDIEKSVLVAPFDGRVSDRAIDEGRVVTPGEAVLEILETGAPQARIGLSPEAADGLDGAATYTVLIDGVTWDAILNALRPDIESRTRTVTALFDIVPAVDGATPRMGALAMLEHSRAISVAGGWIPLSALTEGTKGLWSVFVLRKEDAGDMVRREAVEVLHATATHAYVRGSLAPGERVVAAGVTRVAPGQVVTGVPAGDSPDGSMVEARR
jgi:RND family efflux transporter MFP subunit